MKKVSVREFQLRASENLKELPVVLTVYNKPVAEVVPFDRKPKEVIEHPIEEKPKEDRAEIKELKELIKPVEEELKRISERLENIRAANVFDDVEELKKDVEELKKRTVNLERYF